MNDDYQFESQEEFEEAFHGELGPELKQMAQALNDELGEAAEPESTYEEWFVGECERLERAIGRKLTSAEARGLTASLPMSEERFDLVEKFGADYANRGSSKAERLEMMTEAAQDEIDRQKEDEELPMVVPAGDGESE